MTDEWLSTRKAAKLIGITDHTLYRYVDQGKLPAFRIGRVIRYRRSDVEAFITRSRIHPKTVTTKFSNTTMEE